MKLRVVQPSDEPGPIPNAFASRELCHLLCQLIPSLVQSGVQVVHTPTLSTHHRPAHPPMIRADPRFRPHPERTHEPRRADELQPGKPEPPDYSMSLAKRKPRPVFTKSDVVM